MFEDTITELMKSVDLQPLQNLAAVRMAILVCESEDMQYMMGRFRKSNGKVGFSDFQWRRLCNKAKRKLQQIGVFDLIIDIVLENLWPISYEIYKWILYHVEDTGIDSSPKFYWTPQFNIDYVKTAETLVRNEALDNNKRYKLACFYCLGSEVRSLWEQMSLSERRCFFIRAGSLRDFSQNPIVLYWSYYIQEVPIDYWRNETLDYKQLFMYAVEDGYLSATKYFLRKLREDLREKLITSGFYNHLREVYSTGYVVKDQLAIACFLIGQLPPTYWVLTIFTMQSVILYYFLEWPMQKHFMTVVNRLRQYLNERTFLDLLERIFEKVIGGFKDHDFKGLFVEFWHQCPANIQSHVSSGRMGYKIFMEFVKKCFGFVFEEKSFSLKAKFRAIVFQEEISENITHFEKKNVEFFKFLVRESVTTKLSINRFTPLVSFPFHRYANEFYNLPLGELLYLIDGIKGKV